MRPKMQYKRSKTTSLLVYVLLTNNSPCSYVVIYCPNQRRRLISYGRHIQKTNYWHTRSLKALIIPIKCLLCRQDPKHLFIKIPKYDVHGLHLRNWVSMLDRHQTIISATNFGSLTQRDTQLVKPHNSFRSTQIHQQ